MLVRVLGCARARRSATCVQRNISRCHRWMAHILYCLQHKLRRGTRAVKCSVPATSSRILLVLSLSLSLSIRNEIYTDGLFPPLRRSFRGYSSLFIAETRSFSGSTETLEGDEINVSFPRTYSVGKRVRIRVYQPCSDAIQVRKCFCPHSYVRVCSYVR